MSTKEEFLDDEEFYDEGGEEEFFDAELEGRDKGDYTPEEYTSEDCLNGECYRTLTSMSDDPEIMELSDAIAEGDLDENGVITADDVLQGPSGGWGGGVGNVLSPGLPQYLRNSLLPLDSWQKMETQSEEEEEISALEEALADTELKRKLSLDDKKKAKITKWHMMMIAGTVVTLISIIVFVYKRIGKTRKATTAAAPRAPSPPPVS